MVYPSSGMESCGSKKEVHLYGQSGIQKRILKSQRESTKLFYVWKPIQCISFCTVDTKGDDTEENM